MSKPKGSRSSGGRRPPGRRPERKGAADEVGVPSGPVRLQKVLARAGVASRRASEGLITAGRVEVNGTVVTELGVRVNPQVDTVAVDGTTIALQPAVYIVMNKPDGVVCAAQGDRDDRGRPTVISLLRGVTERVYPVGRLDFHTRGVLLLTNDGDLAARLTHPRHKVPKTYHVKFQGRLGTETLDRLSQGVTLEDGTQTRPLAEISVVKETQTNTWAQLTLMQGLYRQVRRMGEAVGHPVLKLIRVSFAGVTADGLRDGDWRLLRDDEVAQLRYIASAAGPRPAGGGKPQT